MNNPPKPYVQEVVGESEPRRSRPNFILPALLVLVVILGFSLYVVLKSTLDGGCSSIPTASITQNEYTKLETENGEIPTPAGNRFRISCGKVLDQAISLDAKNLKGIKQGGDPIQVAWKNTSGHPANELFSSGERTHSEVLYSYLPCLTKEECEGYEYSTYKFKDKLVFKLAKSDIVQLNFVREDHFDHRTETVNVNREINSNGEEVPASREKIDRANVVKAGLFRDSSVALVVSTFSTLLALALVVKFQGNM